MLFVVVCGQLYSIDACLQYLDSNAGKEQGLVLNQLVPEVARVSTFNILEVSD